MAETCDQLDTCGLPCPADWEPRADLVGVYGVAVIVSIIFCVCIGLATIFLIKGKVENFFVGGRDLPLFVIVLTLASQSIDSNATLGNADLAYKFHYWDGAVLPMGLGLSLVINGIFIARHINKARCLTLPDFYGKAFGPAVEVVVSLLTCISFICLLAGNLVGLGTIFGFLFGGELATSVFIAGIVTMIYTGAGGLMSVAYTDVLQASLGLLGLLTAAAWMLNNRSPDHPVPSIGFPGYLYPDDATCNMYNGVPAEFTDGGCMYNEEEWGPDGIDNGAYPFGDKEVFEDGMMDINAYGPFANAILFNWATIFVLGFGNLAALDFQARCMAARTPKIATMGNLVAAGLTFIVGITFTFMGGYTRLHYGPDSQFASFTVDTCSKFLDLPTCAAWEPDSVGFLKLVTTQMPTFLGAWVLIGISAASMSTSDGAILAISTVLSHNIARKAIPGGESLTDHTLLKIVRGSIVPITLIASIVASTYAQTGYLLIVAFDIVLAGCIAPLFAAIYFKKWVTPGGALAAVLFGSILRAILEFALPKDGLLAIPYGDYNFDYGPGEVGPLPTFIDAPAAEQWDPETCEQPRMEDWTGLDSLISPVFSLVMMFVWSFIEKKLDRTLWSCIPEHWLDPTFTLNKSVSKSESHPNLDLAANPTANPNPHLHAQGITVILLGGNRLYTVGI
ncbi:unnamed protein product [Pylaiella littoralis]